MDKHSYLVPETRQRSQLPEEVIYAIRKRRKLRRRWQRTRDPAVKRRFNAQSDLVKQLLLDVTANRWDSYLESLEVSPASVWQAASRLVGEKRTRHPLKSPTGDIVYSAEGKAEIFADSMEEQFTVHRGVSDAGHSAVVTDFLSGYFSRPPTTSLDPFDRADVESAIRRLHPKRAPGEDRIGAAALKNAPPRLISLVHELFNGSLRLHYFPSLWKRAKIIMIPKPRKLRTIPENHRPISLLPVISKAFERLLHGRIAPLLDAFIRHEQFGFRREHSTTLQLVRVITQLADAANRKHSTAAVLLDVSKAFDRVWHDGLLYKLALSPLPPSVVYLLRSYLADRSFRVFVDGEYSSARPIAAGVPQGSVLGPVLYLVYTNDLPVLPGVTLSLYADDAMYHCSSANLGHAAVVLQRQLALLPAWLRKWRVAINTEKSEAIAFSRQLTSRCQTLSLNGSPIAWQRSVKYLGVTLDRRLSFAAHVSTSLQRARGVKAKLFPFLSNRGTVPLRTKVTIYMLFLRATLTYAAPAFWSLLSPTTVVQLERFQSRTLRYISSSPWFVTNDAIRRGLKIPSLEEFVRTLAHNLFNRASLSTFPHIRHLATDDGPPPLKRRRPRALLDDPP